MNRAPVNSSLPTYLTRFIGRQREIDAVRVLLSPGPSTSAPSSVPGTTQHRWVSMCGVGGCGKTRLALEVARSFTGRGSDGEFPFPDGVRWVEVAPLTDGAQLGQGVATAFRLREAAGVEPVEALVKVLRDQRVLLVIDNCERLAEACRALVTRLLTACPAMVVLTTSRVPMVAGQEMIYAVPPLQVLEPDEDPGRADLIETDAARLFFDRAAIDASAYTSSVTATINQICRRLGGLPLAIELAASWMRVLSARDLLAEIERSVNFLSSSDPTVADRHRSMRAVLDSSWAGLGEEEQQVFGTLSVFSGSFSREAAGVVAGASLSSLSALAEKSLIHRLPDAECETRYHIHELVRQYALERLETADGAEATRARQRHLDYFLTLVEHAEEAWDTTQEVTWLDRVRADQSNVNAALLGALERQQSEPALRLLGGLYSFWGNTSLARYVDHLERALSLPWESSSPTVIRARAKACNSAGYAAVAGEDFPQARRRFDEALELYRQLGDDRLIAWTCRGRSYAERLSGSARASRQDAEQSLSICRAIGDHWGEAWSLHDLGEIAWALGDIDRAQLRLEQGLRHFEELGVAFGEYRALVLLGDVHRRRAQWRQAISLYDRALGQQRQLHFVARGADILEGLAEIALAFHRPAATASLFGQASAWRETYGFPRFFFSEPDYQRCLTAAREAVGADRWSTSFEAGRAMTSEHSMDEAHLCAEALHLEAKSPPVTGLTERELEVLRAVVVGLSSPEIAARLVISPRTVHAHLRSIFEKLDVSTRTAAAHEAARLHLV